MEKNKLFNLYLGVVSIFSIIALAINLGIIITMFGKFFIISDDEYIMSRASYRMDNCENSVTIKDVNGTEITTQKTEDEIKECKEEVKKELVTERRYNLKEDMITALGWFIVFLILFGFHYPKFKNYKEEEEKEKKKATLKPKK